MNLNMIGAAIALWKGMNNHKFNSGAAVTLLSILFTMAFSKFGVTNDQAVSMATLIIGAVGAVIMIVGYIHQWIKSNAANKAAAIGTVTGTADNTIAGGTITK